MPINQLADPADSDLRAILKTTAGTIKVKLFPSEAPKTVENFVTHSKNGYYNGLKFHRVIPDFMIQGGDPMGTGMGGDSIWGEPFEDEFDANLHNIRGALSMANSGPHTNGSQFFIVQASSVSDGFIAQMESMSEKGFPKTVTENYKAVGGTPWLDFKHSVFGQVYDGMDIVDAIANAKTGAGDCPQEDIIVEKIEILEPKD